MPNRDSFPSHSSSTELDRLLLERSLSRARKLIAEDAEVDQARPLSELTHQLESCSSSIGVFAKACELYGSRPALGYRAFSLVSDATGTRKQNHYLPEFHTLSYTELWRRTQALASGWHHSGLVRRGDLVGIIGFASPDFVVAELACLYLGAVSIPLQTNMPAKELEHIIHETELTGIVSSPEQLSSIAAVLPRCPTVMSVGMMDIHEGDSDESDLRRRVENALPGLRLWTISEMEATSRELPIPAMVVPEAGTDPLVTLMYTSGSTGSPKGAMFPESVWSQYWRQPLFSLLPDIPSISVNFMPLNHMMGRGALVRSLALGGVVYFTLKSDMSTLFEDIRLVRPTFMQLVPRVSDMIYQHYQMEMVRRSAVSQSPRAQKDLSEAIIGEMRNTFLGDRLLVTASGSAPTAPEVVSFLQNCFQVPVLNGYGSTEAGAITFEEQVSRECISDYKIVDIPELGYHRTDKPYPRGELRIRTSRSIPGYFKNRDATRELFDEEGYQKTGDIVEEIAPDRLVWIDRLKNVLKLSQGEFVTLWRLESLFAGNSPFIAQVSLYGNSLRAYLLGVVVPDREAIAAHFEGGPSPDAQAVKALLRSEINRVAREAQLRSYEIPRDFLVENEPFTKENGLLTESNKLSRSNLRKRYGDRLEVLYHELERAQLRELVNLQNKGREISKAEVVWKAVQVTLGLPPSGIALDSSFVDLGGDSLNAVRLNGLLQELTGVAVPVGLILNPGSSLSELQKFVDNASQTAGNAAITFETIHGAGTQRISAQSLRLDRFLLPSELEAASRLRESSTAGEAKVALLTGANGFLGRFLTLELLDRVPRTGGKVICVVRAPNDAAARSRLVSAFAKSEPALQEKFAELSRGRLTVLAGDLMKPKLGLSEDVYQQLSREVDLIVHNGALVNHAFSYAQLFEPNVLGTIEVIRLALAGRKKAISFISSVGVVAGLRREAPVKESETGLSLWQERPASSGYAVGYGTSKWAGEILLQELSQRFDWPVNVFRCGMILAHRQYRGQINTSDFFTRLLLGLVVTGIAPESFYLNSRHSPVRPHFDGIPVDFVARSIAGISAGASSGYATYHLVNPQGNDGISFDVIVDWIRSAGYPVERIPDYGQWYAEFGDRLRRLDDQRRQQSPYPILYQWEKPVPVGVETLLDNARFRAKAIQLFGEAPAHLSEEFIHKCLADLQYRGMIGGPGIDLSQPTPGEPLVASSFRGSQEDRWNAAN